MEKQSQQEVIMALSVYGILRQVNTSIPLKDIQTLYGAYHSVRMEKQSQQGVVVALPVYGMLRQVNTSIHSKGIQSI